MNILFFDTETTGLTFPNKADIDPKQPMPVQLGFKLDAPDAEGEIVERVAANILIKTDGYATPQWIVNPKAAEVTGIDNAIADRWGVHLVSAMDVFLDTLEIADVVVAHNINYDKVVIRRAYKVYCDEIGETYRDPFEGKKMVCTMLSAMNIVKALPKRNGQWKWPKLVECTKHFFNEDIEGAHDALVDVRATAKVYYHLHQIGAFTDDITQGL